MNLQILAVFCLAFIQIATCQFCINSHMHCTFWSQNGECESNPNWMRRNCQKACGTCLTPPSPPNNTQFQSETRRMDIPTSATTQFLPARPSGIPQGCNSVMTVEALTRQVFSAGQQTARFTQRQCADQQIAADCTINTCFHKKYRSMDGTCNNLQNSIKGASFVAYLRLLPAAYDDGVNTLVSASRRNRPSPREVTMFLISSQRSLPGHTNSLLMLFGQFLSHDITSNASPNACECGQAGPLCAAIMPPPSDRSRRCIPFARSFPICGTGQFGKVREQLNQNTAAIDASQVYGSESITGRALRFGSMLRTHVRNGRMFPPVAGQFLTAGDARATLFVGLAALHTSFLRLHNKLAASLQNMNRNWNADRIFQETRKIVGAVSQVITYQEYIPELIGDSSKTLIQPYNGYNPNVQFGILNEFAAGAYRLHGMIQESYPMKDVNFRDFSRFQFMGGVNSADLLFQNIDALYRGMMATPVRTPQRVTTALTEQFFVDMATINIQRGRDHGLRSYNDYRKFCNLPPVTSFNNWAEVTDDSVRQRVAQLYSTPNDVDFYVGGVLEQPQPGSLIGPTFSCIVANQMQRLRDGDRFYFENPGVFTSQQVAELRRTSLAWVLCQTGDNISRIGRRAFDIENGSRAVSCSSITGLNLEAWRE